MGVKFVPYSLLLIRKATRNDKYVSFLIPYLIRNKEWLIVVIPFYLFAFKFAERRFVERWITECRMPLPMPIHRMWIRQMLIRWILICRMPTRWMPISRMSICRMLIRKWWITKCPFAECRFAECRFTEW